MVIDLKKYDGRYIEILYSSAKIIGKLYIGEEITINDAAVCTGHEIPSLHPTSYFRDYLLANNVEQLIINERNILTFKDVTDEISKAIREEYEREDYLKKKKKSLQSTVNYYYKKSLERKWPGDSDRIEKLEDQIEGFEVELSLLKKQKEQMKQIEKDIEQLKEKEDQNNLKRNKKD